ncbi:MAG: alpha/beta hydrolase [Azovibrio sp.]|uniref:alpha/beta fold hydrolase n=1 Tax=Azovibrio sp. TaxID=1872673 RepID=UPI003C72B6CA
MREGLLKGWQKVRNWLKPDPEFREYRLRCPDGKGSHRMAYRLWGDPGNPRVLVCVHGLTRNSHDFDFFARSLARHYRVVCPDVVGRGQSDWLADKAAYAIPQYVSDMLVLLARLDVEQVDWLGTSMGGLIGMALAALPDSPIQRLVLNDVGPVISRTSLQRIATYVGQPLHWDTLEAAGAYFRNICAPFGALEPGQWQHLIQHSLVQGADGSWRFSYDPDIAQPFRSAYLLQDVELWSLYEAIHCPVLAIRGAKSDLLTQEVWRAMGERGPRARLAEIPGVGHAPTLMDESQMRLVRDYLLGA